MIFAGKWESSIPQSFGMQGAAMMRTLSLVILVFGLLSLPALAQDKAATKEAPVKINSVPIKATSATDGKQMFNNYCASCHGLDAKGNGPAAPALKSTPPDLTRLAARNKGEYPALRVTHIVEGDENMPAAHGSPDMPIWGKLFRSIGNHSTAESQLRVHNLVDYIKGLQVK